MEKINHITGSFPKCYFFVTHNDSSLSNNKRYCERTERMVECTDRPDCVEQEGSVI